MTVVRLQPADALRKPSWSGGVTHFYASGPLVSSYATGQACENSTHWAHLADRLARPQLGDQQPVLDREGRRSSGGSSGAADAGRRCAIAAVEVDDDVARAARDRYFSRCSEARSFVRHAIASVPVEVDDVALEHEEPTRQQDMHARRRGALEHEQATVTLQFYEVGPLSLLTSEGDHELHLMTHITF
jgi:hypothetical protein